LIATSILNDYPELTPQDIQACLAFAADRERRLETAAGREPFAADNLRSCQAGFASSQRRRREACRAVAIQDDSTFFGRR
jgi:hypothetical protein